MSYKRLVIAVDCDDVLVLTSAEAINNYKHLYGTNLLLDSLYSEAEMATWGTNDENVAKKRIWDYLMSADFASIRPTQPAIDAIKSLAGRHELHLVTGRSEDLAEVTQFTLEEYFAGCFESVEHTNFIVRSADTSKSRSKGEVCAAIGADILIDDHVVHAESVVNAGVAKVLLFGDYAWNRSNNLPYGVERCTDWGSVLRAVEDYATR